MKPLFSLICLLMIVACSTVPKHGATASFFQEYDIINFGEYHGTKEMPEEFFALVRQYAGSHRDQTIALGLEIPKSEEPLIVEFFSTGNEDVLKSSKFFGLEYQDGRASASVVNSLKGLREFKNIVVFCFDEDQPYSDSRDRKMAEHILRVSNRKDVKKVFTYSGNLHPRKKVGTPWDKDFRSMGVFIDELAEKKTLAIRGEFPGGESWNCSGATASSCGVKKVGRVASEQRPKLGLTKFKERKNGYDASLYIKKVTASLPWNKTYR